MTLKRYPSFTNEMLSMQDLRRISQLRDEDAAIITALRNESTYKQAFYPNVREVSADTDVGKFDYHIEGDTTAGGITITLPNDETIGCRVVVVSKKVAANTITVDGNGKNINGAATHAVTTLHKCHGFQYMPIADEWRILWG